MKMPRIKHIYLTDKEYEIPLNTEYITVCCDCCLVHREVYTIRDNKLFVTLERDNRSTGQLRRHNENVTVTKI